MKDYLHEGWYKKNPEIEKNVEDILAGTKKKRIYVPRGYEDRGNGVCHPVPEIIKGLFKLLIQARVDCTRSLRELQDLIYQLERDNGIEDPKMISLGGVTQLFDRLEKDLGIYEKVTSRDRVAAKRGERIAKAHAEGKKRPRNLTREDQKKIETQKRLTQANKELVSVEKERKRLQLKAARNARKLKLAGDPTKYQETELDSGQLEYTVPEKPAKEPADTSLITKYMEALVDFEDENALMEMYQEIIDNKQRYDERDVAFLPTPRQYLFLSAPENVVLYGGAAGGGKSYAMVIDVLRNVHHADYNAVIIRKSTPELEQLIDDSRRLYPLAVPGAKFNASKDTWTFPSGAKIRFGFLDKREDKFKYQGRSYQYVGFDELAQHSTDEGFAYLRSRTRTSNDGIQPYVRATANPGSPWVYEMFIKDREPNVPFVMPGTGVNGVKPITMRFIPARLEDNPHLDNNGEYRAMLHSMSDVERRQLLEGDWLASDDAMFPEFKPDLHVIEPFTVPRHWNRIAGLDYGYRDPSASVWFAVNPEDGSLVVYDEFLEAGLTGREFASAIQEKEAKELVPINHPIDWSVFARTGHTGPTIAESMLTVPGFRLSRADKNRVAGWTQIHEHLRPDPGTGAPKIQIFSSCKNLIKQIQGAKSHKTKAEDLDDRRNSDGHWDLLDALRYGIMSRPRVTTLSQDLHRLKQRDRWAEIDGYFSI